MSISDKSKEKNKRSVGQDAKEFCANGSRAKNDTNQNFPLFKSPAYSINKKKINTKKIDLSFNFPNFKFQI